MKKEPWQSIKLIIKDNQIKTVFQPINHLGKEKIIGYEALTRGPTGSYHAPKNLFRAAASVNLLKEMEMTCLKSAINVVDKLSGLIFINFNPSTVVTFHEEILYETSHLNNRIVLELTEVGLLARERDYLANIIQRFRSRGIKIALDDIGSGDRDFSYICELPADYIKIDRVFINGITRHKNGTASHYVAGLDMLVKLAGQLGAQVIAEGVETEPQLLGVKRAGIDLVQGFYFSKPGPVQKWISQEKKELLAQ